VIQQNQRPLMNSPQIISAASPHTPGYIADASWISRKRTAEITIEPEFVDGFVIILVKFLCNFVCLLIQGIAGK